MTGEPDERTEAEVDALRRGEDDAPEVEANRDEVDGPDVEGHSWRPKSTESWRPRPSS